MKEIIVNLLAKNILTSKEEIEKNLEVPKDSNLGDYAFPCFILSRELKKNPAQIASEIVSKIKLIKGLEKVNSSGPYINFFLDRNLSAKSILSEIIKRRHKYGSFRENEKAVIEFPSPNTNKPLHIGHARNIILGQAISNLLNFAGNKVKITNLNNDRGIHICKSILAYQKFGGTDNPKKACKKSDHFVGDYYVKFAKEAQNNPDLEEEAQECLKLWEKGDKKVRVLWKKMNDWAFSGFKETYQKFNLQIDKEYYESEIYKQGKKLINTYLKKGLFRKKEDGAIYVDLKEDNLGEKVVLRADGTSIYITQDLYLALLKMKQFKFSKSIYISATEQVHHFKVLFSILKKLGFAWSDRLYHLPYGLVNLESGRMKSREGTVVDSDDLIAELHRLAFEELNARYPALSEDEKNARAEVIALSALRYYFLKVERIKDLVFKPEESIKFEGDTGPYLIYTYARAKSILRKAKYKSKTLPEISNLTDKEKKLIIQLGKFSELTKQAYDTLSPNIIANYAFHLSQIFNEFYHSNQIIGSKKEKLGLLLTDAFSQVLKNSLSILNIETLEKM